MHREVVVCSISRDEQTAQLLLRREPERVGPPGRECRNGRFPQLSDPRRAGRRQSCGNRPLRSPRRRGWRLLFARQCTTRAGGAGGRVLARPQLAPAGRRLPLGPESRRVTARSRSAVEVPQSGPSDPRSCSWRRAGARRPHARDPHRCGLGPLEGEELASPQASARRPFLRASRASRSRGDCGAPVAPITGPARPVEAARAGASARTRWGVARWASASLLGLRGAKTCFCPLAFSLELAHACRAGEPLSVGLGLV
jgi:hypothetical protein